MELTESEIIITLDLGTKTGWAAQNKKRDIDSGTISLKPNKFDGAGMRFLRFHEFLDDLKWGHALDKSPAKSIETGLPIKAIYYEAVRAHKGVDAAHIYGGLYATLTSWCEFNKIPYAGVPVGTIKKFITGKGNANKQAVMDAVSKLGHDPIDDNEADALALLYYVTNNKG